MFVRYLPTGVAAGDERADFLTVGTYPDANAYENVESAAAHAGTSSARLLEGGLVVGSPRTESSAYLAYPVAKYQVETFDPAGDAWGLVVGGAVTPVG